MNEKESRARAWGTPNKVARHWTLASVAMESGDGKVKNIAIEGNTAPFTSRLGRVLAGTVLLSPTLSMKSERSPCPFGKSQNLRKWPPIIAVDQGFLVWQDGLVLNTSPMHSLERRYDLSYSHTSDSYC